MTPLHEAAIESHYHLVSFLLRHGTSCDIVSNEPGYKPYKMGCYGGFAERGYPLSRLGEGHNGTDLLILEELDFDIAGLLGQFDEDREDNIYEPVCVRLYHLDIKQTMKINETLRLLLRNPIYFIYIGVKWHVSWFYHEVVNSLHYAVEGGGDGGWGWHFIREAS